MIFNIALWDDPIRQLKAQTKFVCEMDSYDLAFLCGMIKNKEPKKLVEIGVAEGGTTAVIVKSLSMLGGKREVFSVDLNETLYCDNRKRTGYEYDRLMPYIDKTDIVHNILLGEIIAKQIDKIGSGIDFVIIDTTHKLPGEVLDFLCVFPYLTRDATVVLHDTNLNYIKAISGSRSRLLDSTESVATKFLFSAVTAEKYLKITESGLPNIAAFTIKKDTYEHIIDLFYLLSFTWAYIPEKNMLNDYRNIYARHYDKMCLEIYDIAVTINQKIDRRMELAKNIHEENINKYRFPYNEISRGGKIVLYGAGGVGREIYEVQKNRGIYDIVLWVDINFENCIQEGLNVDNPKKMLTTEFEYIVVAVEEEKTFRLIHQEIRLNGWDRGKPILGPISQY